MRRLIADSCGWFTILFPLALLAVVVLLPLALGGLGAFFQAMRDLAAAVKG